MSKYLRTGTAAVYIRHAHICPNNEVEGPSCRKCKPTYRAKTRNDGWSGKFDTLKAAHIWKTKSLLGILPPDEKKEAQKLDELTFRAIAEQWWQAVQNSEVGTRKKRRPYAPNTLRQYRVALDQHVLPDMGDRLAADLRLRDWQKFVDRLRAKGLKTNSVNCYINPVRAVYGWACSPRRELLPVNAIAGVELPPVDETPRDRVATPAEARGLIAALGPDDQVVWALAFYTGCRSSEIGRVEWARVDFKQGGLFVPESKSDAGVRWVPMVAPLRVILREAWQRRDGDRVVRGSVRSAKERALGRSVDGKHRPGVWERAGLDPIGLHECRHTFVSYMSAAGVPLKVQAQVAGHEEETITLKTYTHVLPGAVAQAGLMLDAYLESAG